MSGCAVTSDLNRYLASEEQAEALQERAESIVDEWMTKSSRIIDAWERILEDDLSTAGHDIAKAVTAHRDDRAAAAEELLKYFEHKLRAYMAEAAMASAETEMDHARRVRGYED